MNLHDITRLRLHNHRLAGMRFDRPAEVVRWLGAVQAQDFPAAKWALGLRLLDSTDGAVEQVFNEGVILRTHLMRPTWHFVAPEDIRWLLALTAPRVHAANGSMYRRLELDGAVLSKSHAALANALMGGTHLTRIELAAFLEQTGIPAAGLRLSYLMMAAELEGILCSGPRRGKQFTYALLEERVAVAPTLSRDEALAELTRRFFASHGPAAPKDFAWWSGLTLADVKAGLEMVESELVSQTAGGLTYWFLPPASTEAIPSPTAHLLPNYDEYGIAYKDLRAILDPADAHYFDAQQHVVYAHPFILDGRAAGTWKRTVRKDSLVIEALPFKPLSDAENEALAAAAGRYGKFMELPVSLQMARGEGRD